MIKLTNDRHGVPFYDKEIQRHQEQTYIKDLLEKFKNEPASEGLKKKIWEELMMEKYLGRITIPFKVVMHTDPQGKFPHFIHVIIDTKL
jgi:hypothetical protein